MEITRESDYAVRCMLYLAGHHGEVSMIETISREMGIPRSFLAKILQKLTKAGLVRSFRGIKGGFRLAKEPQEITLLDVITVVQPVSMNACAVDKGACQFSGMCGVHPVWVGLRRIVSDYLGRMDFKKLSADHEKRRFHD